MMNLSQMFSLNNSLNLENLITPQTPPNQQKYLNLQIPPSQQNLRNFQNQPNLQNSLNLQGALGHHLQAANFGNGPYNIHSEPRNVPVPFTAPTPSFIAAIPLHFCYVPCNAGVVENLLHSSIQAPVQVNISTEFSAVNSSSTPGQNTVRNLGENELLAPYGSRSLYPHQAIPSTSTRNVAKLGRDDKGKCGFQNKCGIDNWYLKRRNAKLQTTSLSKNKLHKCTKTLKRLQGPNLRRQWKINNGAYDENTGQIRESKMELLRRKGIKAPLKTECPLWNCPRKEYKRKRPFITKLRTRSVSRLSNFSEKSRSPISFSRAT